MATARIWRAVDPDPARSDEYGHTASPVERKLLSIVAQQSFGRYCRTDDAEGTISLYPSEALEFRDQGLLVA